MFRGPTRSLLLWRESLLSAFSEHTGALWQGAGHVEGWRYEDIYGKGRIKEHLSWSRELVSRQAQLSLLGMYCDHHKLKEASSHYLLSKAILSSHHQPPRIFVSAKVQQVSNPWKLTVVGVLGQNSKTVTTYSDCLTNTTHLQPRRRPWDFLQRSLGFTSKSQFNVLQSHLCLSKYSVRLFSLSAHIPRSLNHFYSRPQAPSFTPQHFRTIHQTAPCVVDAWRDCLSLENENRCRQNLGPNLKLYELEKGTKGTSQSRGKNQGKFASILVSLCSIGGEPAFLFTLRSSTLKGRHKGDVSFAGGKSDPSDRDVVATALREAREELGITVASERVWGVLKPLRDFSGMMIAPVLANLGALEELTFKPNPGEVDEIFTLTLAHLCNPQNRGYTHFRTGDKYAYTLPVFRNGKHRVWGLTAVALDHTLKLIVPP